MELSLTVNGTISLAMAIAMATAAVFALTPRPAPIVSRREALMTSLSSLPVLMALPSPMHALEPDLPAYGPPSVEPESARKLLALVAGRRPSDWTAEESVAVDALIEEVVALKAPWPREALRGKWKLAYLQPGPGGAGVDRRIPFPELPGNDSFQVFGEDSVTNIGELLGSNLEVRVSGGLREDDVSVLTAPKRFQADITGGALCLGPKADALCAPLPIKGVGIFDGVYLGKKLRIGQNLNGGGARIVQVRVDLDD